MRLSVVFFLCFCTLLYWAVADKEVVLGSTLNSENRTHSFALDETRSSSYVDENEASFTPVSTAATTTAVQNTSTNFSTSYQAILKKWEEFHASTKQLIKNILKSLIPKMIDVVLEVTISSRCMSTLLQVTSALEGLKSWPMRMIDAMSKIPPGILDGTASDMGDFDECVNIFHTKIRRKRKSVIRGQYCGLEIGMELPDRPHRVLFNHHPLDFSSFTTNDSVFRELARVSEFFYDNKLLLALCVPDSCTSNDIQNFLDYVFSSIPLTAHISGCYVKEPLTVNKEQTIVLTVVGMFITLAIAGTICNTCFSDMVESSKKRAPKKIGGFLSAFAINKNFGRLWTSKRKEEHLSCLDGIRVLTMMWLLIGHMIISHAMNATARIEEGKKLATYHVFQIVVNGFIGADTFFFIGGLLMFYVNYIKMDKKKGKIDVPRFFFHRVWRVMPSMWILLGFVFLLPMMGSGPLWHRVIDSKVENCRHNWWSAASGINSWIQREDMCLQDVWYVSNDLHYCLLVPVILFFLYKCPLLGMSIIILLGAAATTAVALLTTVNDYVPVVIYTQPDKRNTDTMMSNIQYRFYSHLVAYFIGIVTGYLLVKHPRKHIPTFFQVTGWIIAVGTSTLIVISPYEWNLGHLPEQSVSAAYASLHRVAWGLLVAWITFMCATERGGFVNTLLSWKSWRPLSNLSYAAYLVHFPYLWLRNGYRRERISFSVFELFNELFAETFMVGFFSLAFHLLFIAPLSNIEALIFQEKAESTSDPSPGQDDMLEKNLKKKSMAQKEKVTVTGIQVFRT